MALNLGVRRGRERQGGLLHAQSSAVAAPWVAQPVVLCGVERKLQGGGTLLLRALTTAYICDPMDCSLPGFPVLHYLLELAQTHVHRVSDNI